MIEPEAITAALRSEVPSVRPRATSRRPRLGVERRAAILEELALHERFTLKAIGERHGVSRSTLKRLLSQLRVEPKGLRQSARSLV